MPSPQPSKTPLVRSSSLPVCLPYCRGICEDRSVCAGIEPGPSCADTAEVPCLLAALIAAEAKELSTFHDLIGLAGIGSHLSHPWAGMTIFVPSDYAWDDFAGADAAATLSTNPAALEAVLTMHIVDGAFTTADLYDGQRLETAAGAELTVAVHEHYIDIVAPGAEGTIGTIQVADVAACGAVVHMLDAVLVPDADVVVATGPPIEQGVDIDELGAGAHLLRLHVRDFPALCSCAPYCIVDLQLHPCLLYTSPSPRDRTRSRMPSSA